MSATAERVLAALDADGTIKVSAAAVSLPRHYQTAGGLLSQARTYRREGNIERSYILYRRFMVYLLHTIHKHPLYHSAHHAKDKAEYRTQAAAAMSALEELRKDIRLKYAHNAVEEDEEREEQPAPQHQPQQFHAQPQSQPQPQPQPQPLPPPLRFPPEERKESVLPVPPAAASYPHSDDSSSSREGAAIDAALEARMAALVLSSEVEEAEERKEDDGHQVTADLPLTYRPPSPPPQSLIATAYTLPTAPEPSAPPQDDVHTSVDPPPLPPLPISPIPVDPPTVALPSPADTRQKWANLRMPAARPSVSSVKAVVPPSDPAFHQSLPMPSMGPQTPCTVGPYPSTLRAAALPSVPMPRPVPPPTRTVRPSPLPSFTTSSLRPLHLPTSLMATFMQYAHSNTVHNIETCAILAGQLSHGRLVITHCILPAQRGSASTCATIDELDLLAVQSRLDLLTLGWIHTHPSQSCFLSSVDLHTQYGYQMMMAEAIAIVMAPTAREQGVYTITKQGMDVLGACDRGGFHEHDTSRGVLYGQAMHVVREDRAPVQFIDLRKPEPAPGPGGAGRPMHSPANESSLYPGLRHAHPH